MESLCERVEKKELDPHLYEAFPLERANEAMEVMREKKVFGKVILCMNGEKWRVCLSVNRDVSSESAESARGHRVRGPGRKSARAQQGKTAWGGRLCGEGK